MQPYFLYKGEIIPGMSGFIFLLVSSYDLYSGIKQCGHGVRRPSMPSRLSYYVSHFIYTFIMTKNSPSQIQPLHHLLLIDQQHFVIREFLKVGSEL